MTRIFIVLLSMLITVLYFLLYGHDNTLSLPLLHSKLEWTIPGWSIKVAIWITAIGWLVLIMQKFAEVQGTIWAVITVLAGAFSTWFAWSIVWGSIECPITKFLAILSCAICSFGISLSLGYRRIK